MMTAAMINTAPSTKHHLVMIQAEGEQCSVLYSDGTREAFPCTALSLIDEICLRHGSSMKGRTASYRYLLGQVYKPCILLDEKSEAVLIPCGSIEGKDTLFVLYNDIVDYRQKSNHSVILFLRQGMAKETGISYRSLQGQMRRCEKYLAMIDQRMQ